MRDTAQRMVVVWCSNTAKELERMVATGECSPTMSVEGLIELLQLTAARRGSNAQPH